MLRIYHGGMMRCCIETLRDYLNAGGSEDAGAYVTCKHCKGGMEVLPHGHEGALGWFWARRAKVEAND